MEMASERPSEKPNGPHKRRLTTVVATDICGYSSLSEQNDQLAINTVDAIYVLFEKTAEQHQGRVFNRIADGFLAEFPTAESAIQAAVEFTKAVKNTDNITRPISEKVAVRTGIHVGDVTERKDGNLLGHGVNVAVRLQEYAPKNGILASKNIVDLLGSNFPYHKTRRGVITLKNISTPIVAFDVSDIPTKALTLFIQKMKLGAKKYVGISSISIVAFGILGVGNIAVKSNILESRISKIQTEYFTDPGVSASDNELDAAYLYRVLHNLSESRQPTDQTVFALIETGNVEDATAALEAALSGINEDDSKYLTILHQIGALTHQRNPKKSIEAYSKILDQAPNDVAAITRLGLSYIATNNVCKAGELLEKAVAQTPKNTDQFLKLEMNRAFNFFLKGQPKEALKIASVYKENISQRPHDALWSQYQTNMGIYLERNGQIIRAEALLSSIIARQEALEDEVNLSRSYNVLGLINVRKAKTNPDLKELYYRTAKDQFSKQLNLDIKLQRYHTAPEANYYLGQTNLGLGNLNAAKQFFEDGRDLANTHGIINFQFLNELGLATVEKATGNDQSTCARITNVQQIYDDLVESEIGPKTKTIIKNMGCGFTYKPQPKAKRCSEDDP